MFEFPLIAQYLPGILTAYAILFIGASSPGPSVALLIGIATEQGRTPALVATLGIAFAGMTLNVLTLMGIGILLSQAAWAMTLLRVAGAAYLLYLAFGAYKKAIHPPQLHTVKPDHGSNFRHFANGYLLQITNPKAISFWLAVASVGAVDNATLSIVVLFVFGAFFVSFAGHAIWSVALSANKIRTVYVSVRRWIEMTLGTLFLYFSYKLATNDYL